MSAAGASPRTLLGELTVLPKLPFLVRPETIVFGRTYVLLQMFIFSTRNLGVASADQRESLHGGQY